MSRSQKLAWRVFRPVVAGGAKLWFRYKILDAHKLPQDGAYILCPTHRSNLDTPLLPVIRSSPIRFMGKASLWEAHPFADWFLTTLGGFPVERGAADRGALRAAEEVLMRGETLVMFPEGTRREGAIVQEENMFAGPSFVSGRQQVPIIPIGLGGTERAMPVGSKFVYPRKVVFVIGDAIPPPQQNENGRVSRRAVKEHTDLLRETLQELFDRAMVIAGS